MKKPLPSLAIAIAILGLIISPFRLTYAEDAPVGTGAGVSTVSAPDPDTVLLPPVISGSDSADGTVSPAPAALDTSTDSSTSSTTAIKAPDVTSGASSASSSPVISLSAPSIGETATSSVSDATTTPLTSPVIATSTPLDDASTTPDVGTSVSDSATTTSTTISDASTGNNIASSTATSTIQTGDAIATSNITNVVNVNLFDSDALIAFLDNISGAHNNIDLNSSAFGHDGSIGCDGCSVSVSTTTTSTPTTISASSTDTATISNTAIVRASTGGNSASGGGAGISTGNAYAAGNVATLANATLVDSHYVMLTLNNFGTWGGDLILPNMSFWDNFLNASSPSDLNSANTSINNSANVMTDASTTADTGNNTASSTDGGSIISTGSAQTATNAVNDINQTHIGGGTVQIIFHVFGNWSGQTFNLPPGFMATPTADGLIITASGPGTGPTMPTQVSLDSSNTASIQNTLNVSASTGGNTASGSNAGVSTGNAYAAANSLTAANVTSISHNWLAAIVNVFGDWNGNLSFGQPDLWVGIRADLPDGSTGPGNRVVYTYTVKNNGDADAHGVRLSRSIGSSLIQGDSSVIGDSWDVGTLAPGESRDIVETAHVTQLLPFGDQSVSNTARVTETETDGHDTDNSDVISLVVGYPMTYGGGCCVTTGGGGDPRFVITKTEDATSTISASSTVDYTIHLINQGGQANHAIVADQITDSSGTVIHSENWDLGIVHAGEDITLTYTALFSASTTPGAYMNSAQVYSADGQFTSSTMATTSVTIGGSSDLTNSVGVAGASSSGGTSSARSTSFATSSQMVTVRPPLSLGFLTKPAPLPPDAGGPANQGLLAAVGAAASSPYSWLLYLLVIIAGLWYLTTRRRYFGWSEEKAGDNQTPGSSSL